MMHLYFDGNAIFSGRNPRALAAFIQYEDLMWWMDNYQISIDNKPRFPLRDYVAKNLAELQSSPENN